MHNTNDPAISMTEALETRDSIHRMFIHHLLHCNSNHLDADDAIYAAWIKIDNHLTGMIGEGRES